MGEHLWAPKAAGMGLDIDAAKRQIYVVESALPPPSLWLGHPMWIVSRTRVGNKLNSKSLIYDATHIYMLRFEPMPEGVLGLV